METSMEIFSAAYGEGEQIPLTHTLYGDNLSPPVTWRGVPPDTRSLALILEDRDARGARGEPFSHWVVYNLQASTPGLDLGANQSGMPPGAQLGRNDFGNAEYGGPRPPEGRHQYVLRLFALDATLDPNQLRQPTRAELLAAMRGHVLAEARLEGVYERSLEESART